MKKEVGTTRPRESIEAAWAGFGVSFAVQPARGEGDLEQLICRTARELGTNARLFPLVVTWLREFGDLVARHRLRELVRRDLDPLSRARLGLLLSEVIEQGGPSELQFVVAVCSAAEQAGPLLDTYRDTPGLLAIARDTASPLSKRWGCWHPPVLLKPEALRSVDWVRSHVPEFRARIIRKGDLRVSVLAALRYDLDGRAESEAQLVRATGATRLAVRRALAALELEGEIVISSGGANRHGHAVALRGAA